MTWTPSPSTRASSGLGTGRQPVKLQTYPPVEPHWPHGTVGYIYIKTTAGKKEMGIRELVIQDAEETPDGYRITAGFQAHIDDLAGRSFVFEVDQDGESAECVPWDDALEAEFNAPRQPFTEAEGTVPIRVGEPADNPNVSPIVIDGQLAWRVFDPETNTERIERYDPDAGWTVNPSPPPVHDASVGDREAVTHGE